MDARSFGRAVEALRQWRTHREAEIDLCPRCPAIEEGTVIGQLVRVGPLYAIACCRIVRVVNEEDRFGFAYGTLPAQPERGEEAFMALTRPTGCVSRSPRSRGHATPSPDSAGQSQGQCKTASASGT